MAGDTLTPAPVGILLSSAVDRDHGARIDAIASDSGMSVRRITTPRDADDLAAIGIAFFSRDLYEGSSVRRSAPPSDAFFAIANAAPHLRWLHVFSSGLDLLPYRPSLARGVHVTGSSGATAPFIAQSVLAAVLGQSRGFAHWLDAQQRRDWQPLHADKRPRPIAGQRAIVVGRVQSPSRSAGCWERWASTRSRCVADRDPRRPSTNPSPSMRSMRCSPAATGWCWPARSTIRREASSMRDGWD